MTTFTYISPSSYLSILSLKSTNLSLLENEGKQRHAFKSIFHTQMEKLNFAVGSKIREGAEQSPQL